MRRREFIMFLGGASAAWSLAAQAQRTMPVVGFLNSGSPRAFAKFLKAFQTGLSEEGFVEGRNVAIVYRWAEGHFDELDAMATELVADGVALIAATGGTRSAKSAKSATTTIPIVFVLGFNPVDLGLVASFNKPGGNITGTTIITTEIAAKRLNLLYDLDPGMHNFAILVQPGSPGTAAEIEEVEVAARNTGRRVFVLKASSSGEIDAAFTSAIEKKVHALVISADPLFMNWRAQLVGLAASNKMPVMYPFREFVDDGGLMSYGPSLSSAYRHAGVYAGRILKGTKPGELPIELPATFELLINLKSAKTLGLTIPPGLLALANEVIE
ncbi:ABC transporter substrate-binding protein [Bradyrhizobium sp.]|uniref:ABC transporter substrate-binding protein n=1 Tax=Bradyrhizobium sp. TaxID=376 RepID=UPI003C756F8D